MSSSHLEILQQYIEKRASNHGFISDIPDGNLGLIVVIPCYNEPNILQTLMSLEACTKTEQKVEVLIVINSHESSDDKIVKINNKTERNIIEWKKTATNNTYHVISVQNVPKKYAGVGYARKLGMDEAIRRFISAEIANGIICSLDADTLVASNYFVEIANLFENGCNGCSIYYEHDINGNEFSSEVYRRVVEYELHLRYYSRALKYAKFPYYFHTIGSSFAVSAKAYCMQGGMNKKQAGEDFYFLQKIMKMGNFHLLNTTSVYPSSRPSDRVIFGTGPVINEYTKEPKRKFLTYNFKAFEVLKKLFEDSKLFYKIDDSDFEKIMLTYDVSIQEFLSVNGFKSVINTINNNIAHEINFKRKFFHWFDGFRVVKYINFAHEKYFEKVSVKSAIDTLIAKGLQKENNLIDSKATLLYIRKLDKHLERTVKLI